MKRSERPLYPLRRTKDEDRAPADDALAFECRTAERHMEVEERELFPAVEGGAETVLTATLPWKIQLSRLM